MGSIHTVYNFIHGYTGLEQKIHGEKKHNTGLRRQRGLYAVAKNFDIHKKS